LWEGHKFFAKITTLNMSYVVTIKSTVKISQNFVVFSEYMNFTDTKINFTQLIFGQMFRLKWPTVILLLEDWIRNSIFLCHLDPFKNSVWPLLSMEDFHPSFITVTDMYLKKYFTQLILGQMFRLKWPTVILLLEG
jgi:hypothetical protein